uniref:Protein kinase domain-containing protein n=1 Tax=Caenorhabditis tropicalis TaxID=1561998 RepID=A0A1I7URT3_9PELO
MILRILLTLLILTYSPGVHSQCIKVSRDVTKCNTLQSFNGSTKVIIVRDCPNLAALDDIMEFGPFHTVTNVTFDCVVNDFPWDFTNFFPNIRYIHFNMCNLTTLPWQSVYAETLRYVDISGCPMECSCQNQWMKADGSFERLKEPLTFKKCIPDCDPGRIAINQTIIIGDSGENVTIHSDIHDKFTNRTFDKPYFEWAYAKIRHNYEERVGESSADLVITNLSREDMGLIGVRCWHCVNYLTTTVELRVNLPVKVEFVEKTRGDTDFLVVQGYPIENISLSITRVQSNYTETNIVDTENDAIFFSSLIVRPEKRNIFYQRTYRIFTKDIADGDHLSGDLRFQVCTNGNCDSVEKHVSHLGLINGTLDDYIIMEYPYRHEIQITIFLLIICVIIILIALCLYFRKKLQSYMREKILIFRKRISLAQDLHSRRASHETEETLLRLEERVSLASDYTNMTIQFIEMGEIEIHEMLGKGHFGQVYLGSWERTGPRSVAVKNIVRVDDATEKEARVLQDLDHPNIVKLYGMTRNNFNLLLVFEHMNHGDLKSYLQKRAPSQSEYLQYPPPLVVDELKWIIKEITLGVVYLVDRQIVHRDLAARNCLVSGESDMKASNHLQRPPIKVKISDFGMSRKLYDDKECYQMDSMAPLPVRWLPPEAAVSHRFTYMSDIWALGVTMWECLSYGKQPFDGLTNFEVSSFTIAGMRPLKPERCPQDMYDLMQECWHTDPAKRITAIQILDKSTFDKIRGGLPYEPAQEVTLVDSYRTNINRYNAGTEESSVSNENQSEKNDEPIEIDEELAEAIPLDSLLLTGNSMEMKQFVLA